MARSSDSTGVIGMAWVFFLFGLEVSAMLIRQTKSYLEGGPHIPLWVHTLAAVGLPR